MVSSTSVKNRRYKNLDAARFEPRTLTSAERSVTAIWHTACIIPAALSGRSSRAASSTRQQQSEIQNATRRSAYFSVATNFKAKAERGGF